MKEKDFDRWYNRSYEEGKRWCICPECFMMHMAVPKQTTICPDCRKVFTAKVTRHKPIIIFDERRNHA